MKESKEPVRKAMEDWAESEKERIEGLTKSALTLVGMLSVDLNDRVSSTQRASFDKELKTKGWIKDPKLTTVWTVGGSSASSMVARAKDEVAAAASAATIPITHVEGIFHVGAPQPTYVA